MTKRPSVEERREAARKQSEQFINERIDSNGGGASTKYLMKSMKDDFPDLDYFGNYLLVGEKEKFAIVPFGVTSTDFPGYEKLVPTAGYREAATMHLAYHKDVGPNKSDVLCPKASYGEPCPICEELIEKAGTSYAAQNAFVKETDDGKGNNPRGFYKVKHKDTMNVWSYARNRIELYTAPTYYFLEELQKEMKSTAKNPTGANFILEDPIYGPDIIAEPDAPQGKPFRRKDDAKVNPGTIIPGKMRRVDLVTREEPLTDMILDMAVPLDKYLTRLSYAEIEAELYGTAVDAVEDEEDEVDQTPKEEFVQEPVAEVAEKVEEAPVRERQRRAEPTGFVCPQGLNPSVDHNTSNKCDKCTDAEFKECEGVFKSSK